MQSKTFDKIVTIICWIIAGVFIFAGITKIANPSQFAEDIDNYRMLPYFLVTIMAIILPWLEIFCGIFLIIGKLQKGAAFTLLILCIIFFIAISSAVIRGLDITCGCFAVNAAEMKVGYTRLVQETILLIFMFLVYFKIQKRQAI